MASEVLYTTNAKATTVYRRWNTSQKDYVDDKGIVIPRPVGPVEEAPPPSGDWQNPAKPPENGSAPFLRLPTELRLEIYRYLNADEKDIKATVDRQFDARSNYPPRAEPSVMYAYLYRSPGRITKVNAISREVIKFFHINHSVREELLDSCFGDRTFVLEASFYSRSVGGLDVLPPRLGMTAWVKKLLIITILDREKLQPKGICNMVPLQEMVNLKELRILFQAPEPVDPLKVANSPVWAIISCVPASTKVTIGLSIDQVRMYCLALEQDIKEDLGRSVDYLFEANAHARAAYDRYDANTDRLNTIKGMLSGSRINHENCRFPTCQGHLSAIRCVNSQTPYALPVLGIVSPSGRPVQRKYHCGCIIRVNDGGLYGHNCPTRVNEASPLEQAVRRLEEALPREEIKPPVETWRASLHRTRRRWRSYGGK